MKKGFIYQPGIRPPYKPFIFKKTDIVLENEEMVREVLNDPDFEFTDRQAFCFDIGYQMGVIDGKHDAQLELLRGE